MRFPDRAGHLQHLPNKGPCTLATFCRLNDRPPPLPLASRLYLHSKGNDSWLRLMLALHILRVCHSIDQLRNREISRELSHEETQRLRKVIITINFVLNTFFVSNRTCDDDGRIHYTASQSAMGQSHLSQLYGFLMHRFGYLFMGCAT